MQEVTKETIDFFVSMYSAVRDGERNESTESEAMFVAVGKYAGCFILSTGLGPMWIGVQNATARMSSDGKGAPFADARSAIELLLADPHPLRKVRVFYSDNSVERMHWLADRIAEFKAAGEFLLYA